MTIQFIDGFDDYDYPGLKWEVFDNYKAFSSSYKAYHAIVTADAHTGTKALSLNGYNYAPIGKYFEATEELCLGFAYKYIIDDPGSVLLELCYYDRIQSTLALTQADFVWSVLPETTICRTSVLYKNEWDFVELYIKGSTVSGTLEIRVNEQAVISKVNLPTTTSGSLINNIKFRVKALSKSNKVFAYVDDLYITTNSGISNAFLGCCSVKTFFPDADVSTQFKLPPTESGVPNYTMINKAHEEDTRTYTKSFYVLNALDDGYIDSNNVFHNDTTDLQGKIFIRFAAVDLPRNAVIHLAYIHASYFSYNGARCYFQKSATPVSRIVSYDDFYSRERTTHNDSLGAGLFYCTASLQELVNMVKWQEHDNAIMFIFMNNSYDNRASCPAYEKYNDPYNTNAARLIVTYSLPTGDSEKYIYTNEQTKTDSYNITVSGLANTIKGVSFNVVARNDYIYNKSTLYFKTLLTYNSIDNYSPPITCASGIYRHYYTVFEQHPTTNTVWTEQLINDTNFGFTTISGS
jgi:hypothetical protein